MNPIYRNHHLRNRLPAHVRHTFTDAQLTAICELYKIRSRTTAPIVDHRVTLRFPWGRFYAVIMVGRDRRSRNRTGIPQTSVKRSVKARLIMALGVGLACVSILGLVQLKHVYSTQDYRSGLEAEAATFHPATVPYKRDQPACEASGREWINGECVDHEHDPQF